MTIPTPEELGALEDRPYVHFLVDAAVQRAGKILKVRAHAPNFTARLLIEDLKIEGSARTVNIVCEALISKLSEAGWQVLSHHIFGPNGKTIDQLWVSPDWDRLKNDIIGGDVE